MLGFFLRLLSIVAFCALAACGGGAAVGTDLGDGGGDSDGGDDSDGDGDGGSDGGGGPTPTPTALYVATPTEQTHYDDTFMPAVLATGPASVMGGVTTVFIALPDTGSVNYAGYLELVVASNTASANVAGDANM